MGSTGSSRPPRSRTCRTSSSTAGCGSRHAGSARYATRSSLDAASLASRQMSGFCADCPRTLAETSGTRLRRARARALASADLRAARRRALTSPTSIASNAMPATIHVPTSLYPAPQRHGILPWQPRWARERSSHGRGCRRQRHLSRFAAERPLACGRHPPWSRRAYQWMPRISEAKIIASRVAVRCESPSFLPCAAAESGNMR